MLLHERGPTLTKFDTEMRLYVSTSLTCRTSPRGAAGQSNLTVCSGDESQGTVAGGASLSRGPAARARRSYLLGSNLSARRVHADNRQEANDEHLSVKTFKAHFGAACSCRNLLKPFVSPPNRVGALFQAALELWVSLAA